MTEAWRPVVGWEGLYEVSDQGRVRSLPRVVVRSDGQKQPLVGRVMVQRLDSTGRPSVRLQFGGRPKAVRVHVLVATAFLGPRPEGMECCHNDGDKLNNELSNLRWDTRSSNQHDRVRHGNHLHAKKTHCPKGHLYDGENLDAYVSGGRNQRRCRTCHRDQSRERMRRNAAQRRAAA